MNDQIITSEDGLEDKLTEVSETVNGDLLQSMFYEWMARLEWAIEHEKNIISIHTGQT
jgi:hypothetical protein